MNKKGALQISFPWLFAIIVGAVILSLVIYAVVKGTSTSEMSQTAQAGKEVSVLFNSLESGFESSQSLSFDIPSESKIFLECEKFGTFGSQRIYLEQKSFGKFTETNMKITSRNNYLFSNESVRGKRFYVFSKSFEMPFEVATLNYLTSAEEKYCFGGFDSSSEEIRSELSNLNQKNLLVEDCSGDEIRVCFGEYNSECDIEVNYDFGYLEKNDEGFYFEDDALMYAAIFSNKEIYECQVQRLMKRLASLASLYKEKSTFLSDRCEVEVFSNLVSLENSATELSSSEDLKFVKSIANSLENKNRQARCRLW